jgi:predicted NUDIX family phosphoesterase
MDYKRILNIKEAAHIIGVRAKEFIKFAKAEGLRKVRGSVGSFYESDVKYFVERRRHELEEDEEQMDLIRRGIIEQKEEILAEKKLPKNIRAKKIRPKK